MCKKGIYMLLVVLFVLTSSSPLVMAADGQKEGPISDAAIVSTSTVDDHIFLYVRSPKQQLDDVTCQIGTSLCSDIKEQPISDLDVAMKTLILVDNSFSIPEENRSKTKELLLEFIAEKKDNELVRLATFDKKVNYLTDYISDYTQLKKAIQSITYHDQETYLTDVLYTVLDTDFIPEETYNRIIILSDGVDNKAVGYTKEELYTKVSQKAVPVYTFGSNNGKNNEELKNMFALSRLSKAKYYLMAQIKDVSQPVQEMAADRNIMQVQVLPGDDLLDGSVKNSKLSYKQDGKDFALTMDVTMPFKVKASPSSVPTEKAEAVQPVAPVEVEKAKTGISTYIIIIAVGVVIVALGIAGIIFVLLKKKKRKNAFQTIQPDAVLEEDVDEVVEPTELADDDGEEKTCRIWDEPMKKTLVLTDLKQPSKTFQVPLIDSVVIGRSSKHASLVIDYDKSVSAKHCEIQLRPGNKIIISDLNSSNGTYVNDSRVLTETEISSGVIIKLGRLELKLEIR